MQPGTLTLAPEEGVRSPRIATRVARELSAEAQQAQQTQREQQREQQAQAPLRAAHERERKLPQKQAARRRQSSERTTTPSNVPLQKRVDDHPNESLIVAASTSDIAQGGKVVFCRACKTELFNKSRSAPLPPWPVHPPPPCARA